MLFDQSVVTNLDILLSFHGNQLVYSLFMRIIYETNMPVFLFELRFLLQKVMQKQAQFPSLKLVVKVEYLENGVKKQMNSIYIRSIYIKVIITNSGTFVIKNVAITKFLKKINLNFFLICLHLNL